MTNKRQREVLKIVLDNCVSGDTCLLSSDTIVAFSSSGKLVNKSNVKEIVKSLHLDGYIEVVYSSGKTKEFYCITLTNKGKNFKAEYKRELQNFKNRLLITVLCACVSFIVGKILIALFS